MPSTNFEKELFFNLGLKGVLEKYEGCFLLYLFLRGFLKGTIEHLGYHVKNVNIYKIPFLKCFNS